MSDHEEHGPYDVITVVEVKCGYGGSPRIYPLYRGHRDEVDAFKNSRIVPGSVVFGALRDSLMMSVAGARSPRELDGLVGLVRYIIATVPEHLYGSPEKVESHIRGENLTTDKGGA